MNELELQRIVDGEMPIPERTRWLNQLDERSPHWRALALGFIADQDLRRCFQSTETNCPFQVTPPTVTLADRPRRFNVGRWSVAMAASLLALVASGAWWWTKDTQLATSLQPERVVSNQVIEKQESLRPQVEASDQPSSLTLVNWQPAGTMRLPAVDKSQAPMELPVYKLNQLSPQAIINQQVAKLKSLSEQYRKHGWRTGLDTHVYEGTLEDGRKLFIPINVMRLEPIIY